MSASFRFALFITLLVLIDWYAWRGVQTAIGAKGLVLQRVVKWAYWLASAGVLASLLWVASQMGKVTPAGREIPIFTVFGLFILLVMPKLVIVVFQGFGDLAELLRWAWYKLAPTAQAGVDRGRIRFLSQIGLALAAIPFGSVLYGLTMGWRDLDVVEVPIRARKLPKVFDGLKVVQISDLHLGSYRPSSDIIKRGVALINAQQPDLILFTGDLVNNFAEEVEPWLDQLAALKARLGKYAILGNHDYGEYIRWPNEQAKRANVDRLIAHFPAMGFRLLMDEHVPIKKDGAQFSLIGVQNWGTRFQQYGDLAKAVKGTDPDHFRLLMSHDPTHWDAQVRATGIDLMLAGHTHGAQTGIRINGTTYSPAQWVYEEWAGLYEKDGLQLYVNRGYGVIGFPGRVGMPPEITVFTLQSA